MSNIDFCIDVLEKANHVKAPDGFDKFDALRALMNITMPIGLPSAYYEAQDEILKERLRDRGVVPADCLSYKGGIAVYRGDITLLKADAIVNACNEKLLGCFVPLHSCVDNAIHSASGLQVRRDLLKIMGKQKSDEPNGRCKVTKGYNLPSSYIFHTVGPKVFGKATSQDAFDLAHCYSSCLEEAAKLGLRTIAFPCISTGIYGFPKEEACKIACETAAEFLKSHDVRVIFAVFSKEDERLYRAELGL